MRAVVQRVREATVSVDGRPTGRIGPGMVVLLAVGREDDEETVESMVDKLLGLRIFEDGERAMNRSVVDVQGEILLVSQFTLYGDCRRGRRPGFEGAAPPDRAEVLYRRVAQRLGEKGHAPQEGVFRAKMHVSLVNDGPVTLLLDSQGAF